MVEAAQEVLAEVGADAAHVHHEIFHAEDSGPSVVVDTSAPPEAVVTVTLDGRRTVVEMPTKAESILAATLRARPDAPYSCTGGMCGTCRARVVDGEVTMTKNYALEPDGIARGSSWPARRTRSPTGSPWTTTPDCPRRGRSRHTTGRRGPLGWPRARARVDRREGDIAVGLERHLGDHRVGGQGHRLGIHLPAPGDEDDRCRPGEGERLGDRMGDLDVGVAPADLAGDDDGAPPGSGRPIESKVSRPMTTGWPMVRRLNRARSPGRVHGMSGPLPMTPLRATAAMRTTRVIPRSGP